MEGYLVTTTISGLMGRALRVIDRFERLLGMSVARGLLLAAMACVWLGVLAAVLAFAYSMTPTFKGRKPNEPEPRPPGAVTAEELLAALQPREVARTVTVRPAATPAPATEDGSEIAALLARIHVHFPGEKYPWESAYEMVCAQRDWNGRCLREEARLARRGIRESLLVAIGDLERSDKVVLLEAALDLLVRAPVESNPLVIDATIDVRTAFRRPVQEVYGALASLLAVAEPPTTPAGQVARLTPAQQAVVLRLVVTLRKRGSAPETFAAFLRSFPVVANGLPAGDLVEGAAATWSAVAAMTPQDAETTIVSMFAVLSRVPEKDRTRAVAVYVDLLEQKKDAAAQDHASRMAGYLMEVGLVEAKYAAKRTIKSKARGWAASGALAGVGAAGVLGLFLCLLAIERHTRILEVLRESGDPAAGDPEPSAVASPASSAPPEQERTTSTS